jgi:hypothetical protein
VITHARCAAWFLGLPLRWSNVSSTGSTSAAAETGGCSSPASLGVGCAELVEYAKDARVELPLTGPRPGQRQWWVRELPELARDAELALRVRGECMRPLIEPGQRVRVRHARMYWPGDVLAVVDPATCEIKLHRCVGFVRRAGTWCVLTQPDAGPAPDRATPFSLVIGRLSGGECDPSAIAVPWSTRLWAAHHLFARGASKLKRWLRNAT